MPTLTAQLHPADLATADMADMELMNATNRDMFSWLLFNSENMAAPTGLCSSSMEDPFRMLSPDDSHDAHLHDADLTTMALHPEAAASLATSVTSSSTTTTTPASISTASTASIDAITNGKATSAAMPTIATGVITVDVSVSATAATKRSKKRAAEDSPHHQHLPVAVVPVKAAAVMPKAMSSTQEGLLRVLESANHVLSQKRQAIAPPQQSMHMQIPKTEPSSGDSASPSDSIQRKQKLERNRESARECRRRKREHILGVEERCRQLERENMELRGQLKAGKEAIRQEEQEKNRVCEELEHMIQRGASEKELAEKIDNFKEQYSDYGHGRRSALNYHMHQIERLLLPTQVTKMCIWALRQDDTFWQDEEDETSLPVILAKELGLSEEQKKKIQQQRCAVIVVSVHMIAGFLSHVAVSLCRGSISLICDNLKSALALLSSLKTEVTNKNSTLDTEMDQLQNILTPTQRAKVRSTHSSSFLHRTGLKTHVPCCVCSLSFG